MAAATRWIFRPLGARSRPSARRGDARVVRGQPSESPAVARAPAAGRRSRARARRVHPVRSTLLPLFAPQPARQGLSGRGARRARGELGPRRRGEADEARPASAHGGARMARAPGARARARCVRVPAFARLASPPSPLNNALCAPKPSVRCCTRRAALRARRRERSRRACTHLSPS